MDSKIRRNTTDLDRDDTARLRRNYDNVKSQLKKKTDDFEKLRQDFKKATDGEKAKRYFISYELKREKQEVAKWKEKYNQLEIANKQLICNTNDLTDKLFAVNFNNEILLDMRSSAECKLNEYENKEKDWTAKFVCMENERENLKGQIETCQELLARFTQQSEDYKKRSDEALSESKRVSAAHEETIRSIELKCCESVSENESLRSDLNEKIQNEVILQTEINSLKSEVQSYRNSVQNLFELHSRMTSYFQHFGNFDSPVPIESHALNAATEDLQTTGHENEGPNDTISEIKMETDNI